ncbi:hypothetical protein M406DRAFT_104555 [Cryphonectria parasitica EP155]|uniref:Uncharacterized protein n=1 Tax=Cryphonectria parasitica (strain ATCC 38755 / EP155) TaxID=660469 RepID=A0A9P4XQ01_CRYP1|nr:uncharacterized protein M406DRAFT_104555 [Cryphonectria parasitica EP155]KAF3759954.1 hypothetical protein M406DRAFT_104555 [Cryphonectria parasitica EP155]
MTTACASGPNRQARRQTTLENLPRETIFFFFFFYHDQPSTRSQILDARRTGWPGRIDGHRNDRKAILGKGWGRRQGAESGSFSWLWVGWWRPSIGRTGQDG